MALKTGVLLLHGLTGMPGEMRPVAKFLEKAGYRVDVPLLAGHGGSHKEMLQVGWPDWLQSGKDSLARLLLDCDQAVVGGLSMGSTISGILAAGDTKRIGGVVMFSPTLIYDGSSVDDVPLQRILRSNAVKPFLQLLYIIFPPYARVFYGTEVAPYGLKDMRLQRQITKQIEAAKRGETADFGTFRTYFCSCIELDFLIMRFRKLAGRINCPVLMLHSIEDSVVRPKNATDTYAMVKTREKRLVMLTGCDHVMTLDLKRNYVARLVAQFTTQIAERRKAPGNDPIFADAKAGASVEVEQQDTAGLRHTMTIMNNHKPLAIMELQFVNKTLRVWQPSHLDNQGHSSEPVPPENLHKAVSTALKTVELLARSYGAASIILDAPTIELALAAGVKEITTYGIALCDLPDAGITLRAPRTRRFACKFSNPVAAWWARLHGRLEPIRSYLPPDKKTASTLPAADAVQVPAEKVDATLVS